GRVLHLGPDEVVARVRHGAIGARVSGSAHRAAGHLAALHQLELDRVPDLGARRWIERRPVFPGIHVIRALVHGPGWRNLAGLAVTARRRRQRKLVLLRDGDRTAQRHADGRNSDEITHGTPPFGRRPQPYRAVSPLNTSFWIRFPSSTSVT